MSKKSNFNVNFANISGQKLDNGDLELNPLLGDNVSTSTNEEARVGILFYIFRCYKFVNSPRYFPKTLHSLRYRLKVCFI